MEQFDKYIGKVFKDYLTGKYFLVLEINNIIGQDTVAPPRKSKIQMKMLSGNGIFELTWINGNQSLMTFLEKRIIK